MERESLPAPARLIARLGDRLPYSNFYRFCQLLAQRQPGELRYAIEAELKGVGLVRYGTEFMPEGKIILRHLKQQQFID